jgi:hypothetical protein
MVQPVAYTFIYRFMSNKSAEYPEGYLDGNVLKSFFETDLVAATLQYPQFLDVGGNTGKTNSFTGVDLQDLTGGAYNLQNLAEGDNALCFAYQFAQQAAPDLLKGLFSSITKPLSQLNDALAKVFAELSCPQLKSIGCSQFNQYPGSKGTC